MGRQDYRRGEATEATEFYMLWKKWERMKDLNVSAEHSTKKMSDNFRNNGVRSSALSSSALYNVSSDKKGVGFVFVRFFLAAPLPRFSSRAFFLLFLPLCVQKNKEEHHACGAGRPASQGPPQHMVWPAGVPSTWRPVGPTATISSSPPSTEEPSPRTPDVLRSLVLVLQRRLSQRRGVWVYVWL